MSGLNERVSQRKYEARIELERQRGLLFVRDYAAKVEEELGL